MYISWKIVQWDLHFLQKLKKDRSGQCKFSYNFGFFVKTISLSSSSSSSMIFFVCLSTYIFSLYDLYFHTSYRTASRARKTVALIPNQHLLGVFIHSDNISRTYASLYSPQIFYCLLDQSSCQPTAYFTILNILRQIDYILEIQILF